MKARSVVMFALGIAFNIAGCKSEAPISPELRATDDIGTLEFSDEVATDGLTLFDESTSIESASTGTGSSHTFRRAGSIKVMDWNIYIGTNVDVVLGAEKPEDVPVLAAQAFQLLLSTDFPERARAIAKQVARGRPHLIGLQEVSLLRTQSPGDAVVGGTTPAERVLFDYLEILMSALREQGQHYRIAGKVQNTDVEIPMIVGTEPLAFDDIRVTDFDVVLARQDVQTSSVRIGNYQARLVIPSLGVEIVRGYVAVDARVGRRSYRFVTTHLEPATSGEQIQLAQAQELVTMLADEHLPVILTGDFNTRPPSDATYQFITSKGFTDIWPLNRRRENGNPEGFTSPHADNLRNEDINLFQRIDYIFVRNHSTYGAKHRIKVTAKVVGDELRDRTETGLWPSDHAGILANLRLPVGRYFVAR